MYFIITGFFFYTFMKRIEGDVPFAGVLYAICIVEILLLSITFILSYREFYKQRYFILLILLFPSNFYLESIPFL